MKASTEERCRALQLSKDHKLLLINGKKYKVQRLQRYATQKCNASDKTDHCVASVAHPFRGATLQRHCVCQWPKRKTFEEKLQDISSLDELYGFANRRKILQMDLPRWTEEEREMILARKRELEDDECLVDEERDT